MDSFLIMVVLQENVQKVNFITTCCIINFIQLLEVVTTCCIINFIQPLEVVTMGDILSLVGDKVAY